MIKLAKKKLTATPASNMVVVDILLFSFASDQIIAMDRVAPKKEKTEMLDILRIVNDRFSHMHTVAPKAAPADTPNVNGETSGFRNIAWKTSPPNAKMAPAINATMVRGMRIFQKMI